MPATSTVFSLVTAMHGDLAHLLPDFMLIACHGAASWLASLPCVTVSLLKG